MSSAVSRYPLRLSRRTLLVAVPTALALLTAAGRAQDCDKLLVPDTTIDMSRSDLRLAYLHTLDRTQYEQASHGGGFEATIPVDGVPLKEAGNYSDFQQHLTHESKTLAYHFSHDQAKWYYATRLPADRTNAYLDCFNSKNLVLHVKERTNDNRVVVEIKWLAPPGVTSAAPVDFSESVNAVTSTSLQGVTLKDKQQMTLVFRRIDPKIDMVIVANSDYYTASYRDPAPNPVSQAPPPPPPSPISVLLSAPWQVRITYGQDADHNLRSAMPPTDTVIRFARKTEGYLVWKVVDGQPTTSAAVTVTPTKQDSALHLAFWFDDLIPSSPSPFCKRALSTHGAYFELDFDPQNLTLSGVVKVAKPDQPPPYVCGFVDTLPK